MLTTIREKTQGIIATFILVLIVIPFALWGINSYFEGGTRVDVASVNGDDISEQTYRSALEGLRRRVDPRMADSAEIKRLVIDGLIDQALLVRDAEVQGYRFDNERLARMIRQLPYFQSGGNFDPALYRELLRREGIGISEFENQRRAEVVTSQVQSGLSESGIVTGNEIDAVVRLLRQERTIAHALVSPEKFLASVVVTREEIEQYYNAHPDFFRSPEQVRIEYVRLSASDLIKDYQPTSEELRSAYAEEAPKAGRPETRRAAHILISLNPGSSEEEAKKALGRIEEIEKQVQSGADFAKLARAHSQDTESAGKGGDLGEIRAGILPKSLEDAAFALKPGQLSKPVRTEFGYHLVKLTAYKPGAQKSFEELKPQLVKLTRQRKAEERFYEASEKLRNLAYEQSDSLSPAAEALGLRVETTDWFGRNGGNGIAAYPRVIEAAFSSDVLTQGRNSDAIEIAGDALVAIRVAGHRPAEPKPLASVQPQIERTLRQQGAEKAAKELGDGLIKELTSGSSLEALARKHGLKYQSAKTLTRDKAQGFDRRVVEAAFRAARPEPGKAVYGGVELAGSGYAVYSVTRVTDGDPTKADSAIKDRARRLLAARRGSDYYANYRAGLRQKADIKIRQEQL